MEQLYSEYRHFKTKSPKNLIPVLTICCLSKPYIERNTQKKIENTYFKTMVANPNWSKTSIIKQIQEEKYPAAIKHIFSNVRMQLFRRMKTADTSSLLSLDLSV